MPSAVHLVAGMAKSTFAAVSDLAGVLSPVGVDLSDLGFDPPGSLTRGPHRPGGQLVLITVSQPPLTLTVGPSATNP